ncbi:MAG: helix-turn-helix domain-containing protein [Alphaproteobacteria bacterium]|nr:helix-turn-helix domain-containing protein [Alphaproteobacteria bacterium]MDX5370655.1 helix-turn-helix domain-containing protein [Alphaproteobacteria bacterium]MDX5465092.1 helix-turn-helix domain-containing protein [Alphaproteobacteria bacterium]
MSARNLAIAEFREATRVPSGATRRSGRPERDPDRPIGAVLRDRRLGRNEDAHDTASKLCLTKTYLFALEEGAYDRLPAACYTVGYARAYARHLGLDADEVAGRVKAELEQAGRTEEMELPRGEAERRAPRKRFRITLAGVVGLCIAGVVVLASVAALAAVAIF